MPGIDYAELVTQAEQAVQGVKDGELRRVAFEKVLDRLLHGPTVSAAEGQHKGPAGQKPNARAAKHGGDPKRGKSGPKAYISEMESDGFFSKPKTITEVKAELENRGHHIPLTNLSGPLQKLCQAKVLRRQKVKAGKKQVFSYSKW